MADKRADQLKEITERLEQGVKDIFTSEMYTKYLLTMSKFHNYSFNNTLLIAMQRPDATLVAGYNAWKNKFNRYVKKGEKGIQIIAPAPVKEREEREKIDKDTGLTVLNESGEPEIEVVERVIPRFRVTTVFDYAQTDGEPLPTLEVNELTARVKDYTLLKEAIEQVSPVPIRFGEIEGNAKGYYSHMDKEICVRADMGESQTIKTMIHEVAHAMLHDSDQMKQRGEEKDQLTKETEAESIAFTVCSALGIDTSDYSFPYVASWASGKELKELKDSMDTIRLTAADFLEKLETAVAERSVERMTAMEYAEKLIADKERDKTVFDNSQRNLIVNFAYKLDDRAATEELANNLAAAVAAENTEEINRLMWEAEEKIESLPDGMIGLSEMHEYGYLKDDVLPLTKEGAREWHRLGERIYPLFQDGTAGDFASQEEIEQHNGIFGIKADAWSAILLEKNEEYSRKTKLGRVEWNPGTLAGVLANERHCGDVLARKTFTPNFLTHKSKKNNNDRTQYRQKNHHEAIVSREVFNAANHLRASRNYSKKDRPLPVLSVVEDGILRGYVPFDKDWTGFSAEEYREASESVMKEPDVTVTADVKKRLDLTGYEIVRVQYFSTMQNPAMTISNGRLRFNTACLKKFENVEYVELLLNSVELCIAIRPCDKNNPNAIRWGRLKEGRWCASTLGCRGLAKTLFDIMEWDEDLRYRFRGQFLEQGDNKMMLFAFDEPEMIKVEEIVLPPKENTEEDEGETVKKKIYIFPPEWAGTFGQPITSIAQVGILRQEHYAGNWDVFRPATEIEEMNIFTAESLNELLREAEKIMEGWTDYR